jgi:hypothetical protein
VTNPRPIPDPIRSAPELIVFIAATFASCFAAGYALAAHIYDRLTRSKP